MPRLKRAASVLESAYVAFQAGQYPSALEAASRVAQGGRPHALDASVLIARIHLRIGTPAAAVAVLEPLQRASRLSATGATLLGVAYCRLGDAANGVPLIESAFRHSAGTAERAEAAYYRAWVAYVERDLDVAERWIASSLDDAAAIVYTRGLALSGWSARRARTIAARFARTAWRCALCAAATNATTSSPRASSTASRCLQPSFRTGT